MKKILILFVVLTTFLSGKAQNREDSDGNTVYHSLFAVAQYQINDFDDAKSSGSYGVGVLFTSFSHWDRFHLGANLNISVNAGLVHDWGLIYDLGPSVRFDLAKHVIINVPVNVICNVYWEDGASDPTLSWGGRIAPSIHAFVSEKVGFFAGPQVNFGFSGGSTSFGMQAGVSYSF